MAENTGFEVAHAPNDTAVPKIHNIFDVSADFLGQLRTWFEQNPMAISVKQIQGYNTNTVKIYKKAVGVLAVSGTTVETDIVNEVIPGGQLGLTGVLRLTILGAYQNTSGGNRNLDIKFYLGATLVDTVTRTGVTNGFTYPASFEYVFANQNATNSQILLTEHADLTLATSTESAKLSKLPVTSAVDTSVSQTLRVTVTHDAASANAKFTRYYYMIEFL